jgi:hypothetical protein
MTGLTTDRGVIDASYRGEIKIILVNRHKILTHTINKGDRFAQLIIIPIYQGEIKEVQELDETTRGKGGFGSTGVNTVVVKKEITNLEHKNEKQEKHSYALGQQLNEKQRNIIRWIMKKYEDVLATDFAEIKTQEPKFWHDIDTGVERPIRRVPYRIPHAYVEWTREEAKRMHAAGIIERSISPWASASLIVPKKDGDTLVPR